MFNPALILNMPLADGSSGSEKYLENVQNYKKIPKVKPEVRDF